MEAAKTDKEWSERVGRFAASTLVVAGVLSGSHEERAAAIIAEEVLVRLIARDRPPSNSEHH